MPVKFTPGPHPDDKPRHPSPFPRVGSSSSPSSPISPLNPHTAPARAPGSRVSSDYAADTADAERQPLLSAVEVRRTRVPYPAIIAGLVLVLLVIVGLGGWRLGKGAGGGRWPGGPGFAAI